MDRIRFTPEHWANELTSHYYDLLNQTPEFASDLTILFDALDTLSLSKNPDAALQNPQAISLIESFCKHWPLPKTATEDILFAHQMKKFQGDVLTRGVMTSRIPAIGEPMELAESNGVKIAQPIPMIAVKVDQQFEYNPLEHNRKDLNAQIKAVCDEIRHQAQEQAKRFEQQAEAENWKQAPSAYHEPATIRETAQLLYLRVIKGSSWGQISEQTKPQRKIKLRRETEHNRSSVIERVQEAALLLGIPLR